MTHCEQPHQPNKALLMGARHTHKARRHPGQECIMGERSAPEPLYWQLFLIYFTGSSPGPNEMRLESLFCQYETLLRILRA